MKCRPRGILLDYFRFGVDPMPKWFKDRVDSGEILYRVYKPIAGGPFDEEEHCAAMITRSDGIKVLASQGDCVVMLPEVEIRAFNPDYFVTLFQIEEEEE